MNSLNVYLIPIKKKKGYLVELYRHLLSGTFSELLGVKLRTEERMCIAKGDPYCEFVLTKEGKSLRKLKKGAPLKLVNLQQTLN